jgi:hypothetical protein
MSEIKIRVYETIKYHLSSVACVMSFYSKGNSQITRAVSKMFTYANYSEGLNEDWQLLCNKGLNCRAWIRIIMVVLSRMLGRAGHVRGKKKKWILNSGEESSCIVVY